MTLYYDDNRGTARFALQDFEPSFGMKMNNAVREAWLESYGPVAADRISLSRLDDGPKLSASAAAERIKSTGIKIDLSPRDNEYTEAQLDFLIERQRELAMIRDVRDRTSWDLGSALRGVAMFGAGILDPLNLATAFVPWTKAIPAAQGLRAAAMSSSLVTRTAGRVGFGAADAGISTAVLEPFYYGMRQSLGDDYDGYDAMANIAFGTLFGGGVMGLGGAGVDAFRRAMGRDLPSDAFAGLTVDEIQQVQGLRAEIAAGMDLRDAQRVLDTYTPEMRRAAGFPDAPAVEPAAPADTAPDIRPPSRTAEEIEIPEAARRNDLLAFIRDSGGVAPNLARDAGGESGMRLNQKLPGLVKRSGAENYDELTERLIEDGFLPSGMDSGSAEAVDMAADMLTRAMNGERILRIEDQLREAELRARQDFDDADRDRFEAELEERMEREAIQADTGPVFEDPTADEMVMFADPVTREAAMRAAVAQSAEGRVLDVDAIMRTDDALGATAGDQEIADAAARNRQAEAVRVADFDASAAVDARNASAPKWDGLADAEAAAADADALLSDTVKAGDQAFKYARARIKDIGDVTQSEAFKRWSNDAPLITSQAADTYQFKTGEKVVVEAFHGTKRPDRVGTKFLKKRATSGPMAYFTSNPTLASSYAMGKQDTSLPGENQDYSNWFKVRVAGARNPVDVARSWYSLPEDVKKTISERLPDIRTDDDGNVIYEKGGGDIGAYEWELKQTQRGYDKRGNPLKAAVETWLTSGALFDSEVQFMDVLRLAGMPMRDVEFDSPFAEYPSVYKTFIAMQKPLVTSEVPQEVVDALNAAAKKDRSRAQQSGADMWDKNTRTLRDWVAMFNGPDNKYVWTSIPDKVTQVFRDLGYDGIIDWSGKAGGDIVSPVYIPFEEPQVKSALGNKGTFDPQKNDILYARGFRGEEAQTVLGLELRRAFGAATEALSDAGQVLIVSRPNEIPGGPHPGDVKAATAPDGTVYIVAENVSPAEARGLLLHEVGVHVGMEQMLGPQVFGEVLTQLDDAIARGESWAQAARAAVPADTLPAHVREEQLAYLVQNAPELPIVQRIIAAVRAWAFRTFEFARSRMTLTEADFRAMAVSALHAAARGQDVPAGHGALAYGRDVAQTSTKAFRDWFGDSKVVDANGRPLVVYHGTAADVTFFDKLALGESTKAQSARRGFFFAASPKVASGYAMLSETRPALRNAVLRNAAQSDVLPPDLKQMLLDASEQFSVDDMRDSVWIDQAGGGVSGANVLPVYLSIQNPMVVDYGGKNYRERKFADVIAEAKAAGHDGVVFRNAEDSAHKAYSEVTDIFVAFRPTQIKSAIGNRGTFDPASPDIRYSRGETPDPSPVAAELKRYDDAVARAKSFAGVLRAAADKLDNDAQATAAMRAAMPDITTQEIDDLLAGLRRQVKGLRNAARTARSMLDAENQAGIMQSDAMRAADMLANNLQMAAVIEKRNAALNMNARLKATSFVNQFKDKGLDFEGFAALLVGSERVRQGSRVSVDAEYKGFRGEWVGGMIADLERVNLMQEFSSGVFDRDIYDALWRMGTEKPDMAGLPKQAVQIAEIVNKYQTDARNNRNRFGAWIRDLQGYITRQSHDMFKIRGVPDSEWIAFVMDKIDLPKMQRLGLISETDPAGSLRAMYDDFAAGVHMKAVAGEDDNAAFGNGANLARRESVSRAIYFKDGLAAYEYNQRFGTGTLAESVIVGLDHAAHSTSLLKTFGTNPEATLTRIMDEYEDSLAPYPERRAKFRSQRGTLMDMLAQVDGSVYVPGNLTAAKVGAFLRAWQTMAKLGGALISSFSDLAGYAAELRYSQGRGLLSGMADGMGALLQGRASGERAAIASSLGVFHESMAGAITARFDSPDLVGGKTSWFMQQFFRLNGLTWWTETLRDGAALAHSNYMAEQAGRSLDQIDPELRRLLGIYNIDAGKWDLLRMGAMQMADGRKYMTPEGLRTVPRSAYEAYIKSVGRTVNDATVQNLQDDLAQALRVMAIDRAHHAVLEPSARTRAFMLRGTRPGTVMGELARYIGQFKSFSIAMVQTVLGREVYGRGYDTLGEYMRKGHGDMLGLAYMVGLYGLLGYGAMAAKDLLKGREPRDPLDPRTMWAALAQGGGMGLYGDFLFGEYSRMGRTFTASLAGPVLSGLDTLTDLWTRMRNGDDLAAASFRALINNTPFMNLFWLRPVLDYLVLYQIQEAMNPGFLRRMEKRIERENGQSFLLPPSEFVR